MKFTKKQNRRQKTGITTASLPDIIFMLLFFFVAIGMVPAPLADIEANVPVITGGEDLEETKRYIHVYIGLKDGELVAQVGYDTIVPFNQLTETLEEIRKEEPTRDIVVLRIDGDAGMGYIRNEIEPAILKAGIKTVKYQLEDEKLEN